MSCQTNTDYSKKINIEQIREIVNNTFLIRSGINKQNEITRLIFEILNKHKITIADFLLIPDMVSYLNAQKFKFSALKNILLKLRYPLTDKNDTITKYDIFLPPLKDSCLTNNCDTKYSYSGKFHPKKIYIEKDVLTYPLTERILNKFPQIQPEIINKLKEFKKTRPDYDYNLAKNELFLVKETYDILKSCPCTKNVVSCGYYILNLGFGCPYDCSYCYLQHYTNFPGIILPVNIEEILNKLKVLLTHTKIKKGRIGTGEFTDSLALDDISEYSKYIIPFFNRTEYMLELKTKSINISNILHFKPTPNIVVAWSLNPQYIIDSEEKFTPSLEERLKTAKELADIGFKVAFHFDPVIYYENWENDYKNTIEKMYTCAGNSIAWISIGTLRFHRTLKPIIENRFEETKIIAGELLIHPGDKKMRYPDFIRKEIYSKMITWIKKYDRHAKIYLCMEYPSIWKDLNIKLTDFV